MQHSFQGLTEDALTNSASARVFGVAQRARYKARVIRTPAAPDRSAMRADRYETLADEIDAVLEGEPDLVARMATVAAMLAASFEHYFWTGFYVVDAAKGDELIVGPYQGSLGCLRIAFGRGVCGAAATSRQSVIAPDVDAFPGHIACDSASRSEVVTPVFDAAGDLIAVLDVDSTDLAAFDEVDARGLEAIVRRVFAGQSVGR
jgi:L-methionine (R)-S-oxide reductase